MDNNRFGSFDDNKVSGKIYKSKAGLIFWIICLGAASLLTVRFGINALNSFRSGSVEDAVLCICIALGGLVGGFCSIGMLVRTKDATVEFDSGRLLAEWGLFSHIDVETAKIDGAAVRGRSVVILTGKKKYRLPPVQNAGDLYRALRKNGVPVRLYAKLTDEELESRHRRTKKKNTVTAVLSVVVVILIFANVFTVPALSDEGREGGAVMSEDMAFTVFMICDSVLAAFSIFLLAEMEKGRAELNEILIEKTARAALKTRESAPAAAEYGEIVRQCRMYDDRFRLFIFRPNEGNGYSFAVEVYVMKTGEWRSVYDFSGRFRFDTVDSTILAAAKFTQLDVDCE